MKNIEIIVLTQKERKMIAGKYEERMLKCNLHKTQVKTVNMEKREDHQLSKKAHRKALRI